MDIITFMNRFYLHDCPVANIGHTSFNNQFVITVDLLNYGQFGFRKGIDPDHIIGNFIFKDIRELEVNPKNFTFYWQEILTVKHEKNANDLDKITFVMDVEKPEEIFLISFKAKEVEWVPLDTFFD